jgi:hypothetical protein
MTQTPEDAARTAAWEALKGRSRRPVDVEEAGSREEAEGADSENDP